MTFSVNLKQWLVVAKLRTSARKICIHYKAYSLKFLKVKQLNDNVNHADFNMRRFGQFFTICTI